MLNQTRIIGQPTDQYSTSWWSDHRAAHQSIQHHMVVRSLGSPPVIQHHMVHAAHQSIQHHTVVRPSCGPPVIQHHMVVRSSDSPPVNTAPHGGQIIGQPTGQHSITWRSDHRAAHRSTQHHMAVRSTGSPAVDTPLHGGQIESL